MFHGFGGCLDISEWGSRSIIRIYVTIVKPSIFQSKSPSRVTATYLQLTAVLEERNIALSMTVPSFI